MSAHGGRMSRVRVARALALALVTLAIGGCPTSMGTRDLARREAAGGVRGEVLLNDGRRVRGELMTMHDSAFVLLAAGRVAVAPFRAVDQANFAGVGWLVLRCRAPRAQRQEALLARSRHPYGIPPEVLERLLRASGQESPDDLGASVPPCRG